MAALENWRTTRPIGKHPSEPASFPADSQAGSLPAEAAQNRMPPRLSNLPSAKKIATIHKPVLLGLL